MRVVTEAVGTLSNIFRAGPCEDLFGNSARECENPVGMRLTLIVGPPPEKKIKYSFESISGFSLHALIIKRLGT